MPVFGNFEGANLVFDAIFDLYIIRMVFMKYNFIKEYRYKTDKYDNEANQPTTLSDPIFLIK